MNEIAIELLKILKEAYLSQIEAIDSAIKELKEIEKNTEL